MISKKHKTIFVHIPKVAGQSIETMFLENEGLDWNNRASLLLRPKKNHEKGPARLAHLRARDYVDYGYIDKNDFDEYYKFSFVRNPYKRVFSFYNFLGYNRIISVDTFVTKVLPKKIEDGNFFFLSQYDYLYNTNGNLLVDFVGKLETINKDISKVIQDIGIENATLPHVNKAVGEWHRSVSHVVKTPYLLWHLNFNKKQKTNFEKIFTKEIKDKVFQLYKKDFEVFDYQK